MRPFLIACAFGVIRKNPMSNLGSQRHTRLGCVDFELWGTLDGWEERQGLGRL